MQKTLKIITFILCFASVFSLCALTICAENEYEDPFAGKTVTRFLLVNKTLCKTEYVEGEFFDPTGLYGLVYFAEGGSALIQAEELTYLETGALTTNITSITFVCGDFTNTLDITVTPDPFATSVIYIELVAHKTDYLAFDNLSSSDFEVKAVKADGTSVILDNSLCTFYPEIGESLSSSNKAVKVTYQAGNIEYSAEASIHVAPVLHYEFVGAETAYLYECLTPSAPRGLSLTVYFDEARTVSKALTTFDVMYPDNLIRANEQGKTTIEIVVDTRTIEFELDVLPISGYRITGLEDAYYYGDAISLENFNVYAIYPDGASVNVTNEVTIEAPATAVFGSTINAYHNSFDLKDFIGNRIPAGTLTVINQPNKVHYEIGEIFSSSGLSLAIEYANGHRKLLSPAEYTLTYTTPLSAEDKFVTAEYFGAKTNISISVGNEAYILSLSIIGSPSVLSYFEGSVLNTSGLLIQAIFSDGTSAIIDHQNLTFSPALSTPLTPDITSVTISANDGTDKYCEVILPISVIKKVPTALIATAMPLKLVYTEGETFDPDGLALSLVFNDMSSIIPASFSFTPELGSAIVLHSNATEKYIIYAVYEYEEEVFTYPIEITVTPAETEKLLVSRDPVKTVYNIGDTVELEGLEMILIYKDRTIASPTVPDGYYTFAPTVIDKDTKEISISFRGLTVAIPITVIGGDTEPPVTTEPEPPVTTEPTDSTLPDETTANETTLEPDVTTSPETSGPDVTTGTEVTTSPDETTTDEPETTTDPNAGEKKDTPSLLVLWIIVIVIIVVALIALIIYYKKNFT